MAHVFGVPPQLASPREQLLTELHRLDEPLAARDDLERPVALLVELDRVRNRPRLADQVARLAKLLDDHAPRLRRGETGQPVLGPRPAGGLPRFPPRAAPPP